MRAGQETNAVVNRPSPGGRAKGITAAISLGCLIMAFGHARPAAQGQGRNDQGPGGPPPPPPPHTTIMPPVMPPPQPVTPPPIIIPTPPNIVVTPIVVPTDVTNPQITNPNATTPQGAPGLSSALALAGVEQISDKSFPGPDKVGKNFDWITVLAKHGAEFSKPNNYTADLKAGDIIVSVKNPSHLAFVKTPYGDIAIGANSDVMVTFNNGVLRILNFDGEGRVLKVKLDRGPFGGPADPSVTIATGYELIASDRLITRAEMRPKDGIARRYAKTLENGHLAISEFSLVSAARNVGMLVNLQQTTTGIKERRIISDLSKMAAVLNYRSGEHGYTAEQ